MAKSLDDFIEKFDDARICDYFGVSKEDIGENIQHVYTDRDGDLTDIFLYSDFKGDGFADQMTHVKLDEDANPREVEYQTDGYLVHEELDENGDVVLKQEKFWSITGNADDKEKATDALDSAISIQKTAKEIIAD